jgi:GrpB-like predicted nucleotidyltransferase (UPF0157 family)
MILVPHDPAWPAEFGALRKVYVAHLGTRILGVEHVGSTAVPGIDAKPILDIDLIMPDYGAFDSIVGALSELGYRHNGDQGVRHREAFRRVDTETPWTPRRRSWMDHHLYVCPADGEELRRHVAFRDALRADADLRRRYEAMKRDIAARSSGDRKLYAAIKEVECRDFIEAAASERPRPSR